jgi:hypothetical protein
MPSLRNSRHEKFCQLVASGIKPAEAYISLGYSEAGATQAANKVMKRRDVQERIDEILSHAAQSTAPTVSFDQARVLNRLDALSRKAEELGQISAAARCEELIGKARGMFVDRSGSFVWDGDLSKLNDEQVDQLQRVMERRSFGDDQKALEAAKLRFALAAGIQVIDLE